MILLPHGGYPLLVATLATMAWMTALSYDGCDFVRITGPAVSKLSPSSTTQQDFEYPFAELGFHSYRLPSFYPNYEQWHVKYSETCLNYPSDVMYESKDAFWSIGSLAHACGLVLGGASCLFLWVTATCAAVTRIHWRLLGGQLSLAAFCHAFSLLWFFNALCYVQDSICHWFYGSQCTVATIGLYAIAAVCVWIKYPEPTLVKLVRRRVEADFQRYERSEVTMPPSDFDEASGIHSVSGFGINGSDRDLMTGNTNRQRSTRNMIL